MNLIEAHDLYRYNDWANERLVAAVESLPVEALARHLGGSFPSIRATFSHIIAGEWIWLERLRGSNPSSPPEWLSSPELSVLVSHLRDVTVRRSAFLSSLPESSLATSVHFRFISGAADAHTLSDLLVHVVNHSTYHRGPLAGMLRQVGASPPSTDFIVFRASQRAAANTA